MKVYGLIGYPLNHSFSKKIFKEIFYKEHIKDVIYQEFPIKSIEKLPKLLEDYPDIYGLSVTAPYKETIIPFLCKLDDIACRVGAVNSVKIFREHNKKLKLLGYNTDVFGFEKTLKPLLKPEHNKALILGTGGASKSIAFVLNKLGIDYTFVSRNPVNSEQISYKSIDKSAINSHYLIINATPVGMFPNNNQYPDIPYQYITNKHILYDLIYNPKETIFLKSGKLNGATTKNGLSMLYGQAEKSWEIWNKTLIP